MCVRQRDDECVRSVPVALHMPWRAHRYVGARVHPVRPWPPRDCDTMDKGWGLSCATRIINQRLSSDTRGDRRQLTRSTRGARGGAERAMPPLRVCVPRFHMVRVRLCRACRLACAATLTQTLSTHLGSRPQARALVPHVRACRRQPSHRDCASPRSEIARLSRLDLD